MKLKWIFLVLLLFIILGLSGVYVIFFRKAPIRDITVRLDWLNQAQYAGMYVAKEKGFYHAHGLNVLIKEYQDGLDQTQEAGEGKVDFAVSTPVELLSWVNKGEKVKAIAAIHQVSPQAFVVLGTSSIFSPANFKGKILGSKGGNQQAKITYAALLQRVGLPLNSAKITDLDYTYDVAGDLTHHNADVVDLYRTDEPFSFEQQHIPYRLLLPEDYGIEGYGDILISSQAFLDSNPDVARNFVAATVEGWNYAIAHQAEALQITAKYQNSQFNDPLHEKFILEKSIPLIKQDSRGPIGSMNYIIWNQTAQEMKNSGILSNSFTVTSAYTTKFLTQ